MDQAEHTGERLFEITSRERGYLTFEQISSTLEEVEITKEQVTQLHAHLVEHGIDVIAEDGVSAYKAQRSGESSASSRHNACGCAPATTSR